MWRPLVATLFPQLPRCGRTHAARSRGGSYDRVSLGAALAPELDKRCRPHLRLTNDSYRVDETYIRIKKQWHYLYRAVDSQGNTLDFRLSASRDAEAAVALLSPEAPGLPCSAPRVITVDKNVAYPPAFSAIQQDGTVSEMCTLRQSKYLNNMIEQDHRFLKRRVKPGLGFGAFETAQRTIQGYEAIHMLRKGQCEGSTKGDILVQNRLINRLFGFAA